MVAKERRKIPLTESRSPRERYYLIKDLKGKDGWLHPWWHYSNQWVVVNGTDRGRGYQGYMSVDFALSKESPLPEHAKRTIRYALEIPRPDVENNVAVIDRTRKAV